MAVRGLRGLVKDLESIGELQIIKEKVDPVLEITEITDRISKSEGGGKALLFENNGTDFPLLINSMGSLKRICMVLGVSDLDDIGSEIKRLLLDLSTPKDSFKDKLLTIPLLNKISSWMPKVIPGKGTCQEVILNDPDLSKLPILKCWPEDGGRFITFPLVHTKDPITGIRNVGMYRMQVFDNKTTGMHWHKHKVGARHYMEYKQLGRKMPIAVAIGGDLVYTYCGTAPLPDNMDEYMLAGFIRKKKVELVKCITQDIEVPADADIIIEGFVDPGEELVMEGPFGDHTGYYSLADLYPKFHVTCITHRRDAIYPATIVGVPPQEDAYLAKATERIFIIPLQLSVIPELVDMELPFAGVAHNLTIVKINKSYAGQALKVMNALWGAGQMMLNKILVVIDGEIELENYSSLAEHIFKNFSAERDVYFSKGPLDVLDHAAAKLGFGGKMGIDATKKFPEEGLNEDVITSLVSEDDLKTLKDKYPELVSVNTELLEHELSILIFSIRKTDASDVENLANKLMKQSGGMLAKLLIFVDKELDISDIQMVTWIVANNIDPLRDCKILKNSNDSKISHLVVDGTRKAKHLGNFERDWPNIIVSNDETIEKIDKIWDSLDLGDFISSPSIKYKTLIKSGGAKVDDKD